MWGSGSSWCGEGGCLSRNGAYGVYAEEGAVVDLKGVRVTDTGHNNGDNVNMEGVSVDVVGASLPFHSLIHPVCLSSPLGMGDVLFVPPSFTH